ncbi:Eco29kI family restriction endonuclease [Williamsia sp. CHRR-6]|uniref:Eco29kI family restriction endonuclease n=1 Tax=Williamsia sp. CHRR-6 TaxID=2835871 RepID=UPI002023F91A|nr:Eco29kI family restriction endonuclease [Williamsia sp. CHRR-6]
MENLAVSIANKLLATPAVRHSEIPDFKGAGIYAIYYRGDCPTYKPLSEPENRDIAVYVGKAVPKGGRKGVEVAKTTSTTALRSRLKEHAKSIGQVETRDFRLDEFRFRYLVVEPIWIPLGESVMIQRSHPVWNVLVDGFGNHDPGAGRINGMRTRWDTLHPGRPWAQKFPQRQETGAEIADDVIEYLRSRLR